MRDLRVELSDGSRIELHRQDAQVLIEKVGEWGQVLSLEDAWGLAEALDQVATSAGGEPATGREDDPEPGGGLAWS
ncbi:MAG: hypothetical protein AB7J35_18335 [Dehalococcoidia bacterium]